MFLLMIILLLLKPPPSSSVDFLYNSFLNTTNNTDILLISDAVISSSVLRLTNDQNPISLGRAFHPKTITMKKNSTKTISSFSTSFVFSILPKIPTSPGFGLLFVLSNTTSPPNALSGQYLGVFSNATVPFDYPLIAIEFDTGRNPEFNDPDGNHVGIDLNNIESVETESAGYYDDNNSSVLEIVDMRSGGNVRVWIEFDGPRLEFNVTIAPVGLKKPSRPLISYSNPLIANYLSDEMFVGFSGSITTWVEPQRILAWSFSDTGVARDINTTNMPVFKPESPPSSSALSSGAVAGLVVGLIGVSSLCFLGCFWYRRKLKLKEQREKEDVEDWELEYWPHRFSYEELSEATNGFSESELLGVGGFGKVYKASLPNNTELAVKCVNHDSKQGLREFMAEIESMGRLQHKNLVQMRGWCRKGNELMLIYDYMPNGSLNRWIFDKPVGVLPWNSRRRILSDVAEGLNYLHNGWDQVVVHRDIKSSNVLLDTEMRGRVGDFGLAKLYRHGEAPNTTRVVGTLGYLAPELAVVSAPTSASDVYSFGVVVLEVVCGRRPIETWAAEERHVVLIDWVRDLYAEGRVIEAADEKIEGEYESEEIEVMLKLGLACSHPDPTRRPTMKEVVAILVCDEAAAAPAAALLEELARGGGSGGGGDNSFASSETGMLPQV